MCETAGCSVSRISTKHAHNIKRLYILYVQRHICMWCDGWTMYYRLFACLVLAVMLMNHYTDAEPIPLTSCNGCRNLKN